MRGSCPLSRHLAQLPRYFLEATMGERGRHHDEDNNGIADYAERNPYARPAPIDPYAMDFPADRDPYAADRPEPGGEIADYVEPEIADYVAPEPEPVEASEAEIATALTATGYEFTPPEHDDAWPRIVSAYDVDELPDTFPDTWSAEPSERDQAAIDAGNA